jgi:hypothetical protein
MATVDKNFRIKHGLVVEGTSGTINGQNILTETGSDQYILDLIGGETLVKSVSSDFKVTNGGELQIDDAVSDLARTGDITTAIGALDTDDIPESAAPTNLYFTDARVKDVLSDSAGLGLDWNSSTETFEINASGVMGDSSVSGLAVYPGTGQNAVSFVGIDRSTVDTWYDANGAAATAQSNAEDYADGLASNYDPAGSAATAQSNAEDYADGLASNYDPAGSASTAETNAKNYADDLIGDVTVDGTAGNTVTARIATAVANLVDSAPEALDTLNELAAALGDNVDGMTGIATAIGNKLPLAGGTMSGNIAMGTNKVTDLGAPSSDNDAATKKYVDDAQEAAEDYADGLASNYDASGTASGLVDDLKDGTTKFTAVNVNDFVSQRAAQSTLASISTGSSIMSWAKSDYASAKAWVKFATSTHSQISEILLTTDSANNVSITEFAEVGTNGSLGTVTASYLAGNIAIEVDTVYANTTVTVLATLIK